ncbi:hypothetical protein [Mongoliitalea lutea]|uniref:Uncharacterized protein n=1 Tax=Mongoliitalea lutea TaxID=849756 RepID=A0A8J3G435_9BACT|nr:hypothetical protein [Mongoliitalea lutea]GHB28032.1 hypothetical protein GCM10008106_05730 [Mongoliitalea lutea]
MKKTALILAMITLCNIAFAQKLKDKLNEAKDKVINNSGSSKGLDEATFFAFPTDPQPVVAQRFFENNKNLVWLSSTWKKKGFDDYQAFGSGPDKYSIFADLLANVPSGELTKFTLPDKVERGKTRDYTPNHPSSSYFYAYAFMSDQYSDGSYLVQANTSKVMFFDNFAIYFDNFSRNPDKFEVAECFILVDKSNEHFFTEKGLEYKDAIKKVNVTATNYFKQMSSGVQAATEAAEAERYEKFGLKNKEVVGLTIEAYSSNKNTQGSIFDFKVKAKLKDGNTIDVEYLSDLDITAQGLVPSVLGKGYTVDSKNFIKDDMIKLKVGSKFHNGVSANYEVPVNYKDATFSASFNGVWRGNASPHGGSVKVEVKSVKDANTGMELYAYKIRANGEDYAAVKLPKSTILAIYARGANARENDKYSGNGGILGFVKDPSASDCKITYGIDPGSASAYIRKGNEGVYTETVQKLSW